MPRYNQQRQCTSKAVYLTRKEAALMRKSLARKYPSYQRVCTYHCQWCGHWHLGNKHTTRKKG